MEQYHLIKIGGKLFEIPTAEQMIGWLEEQGISVEITRYDGELRALEYHLFGIKSCKALFSHRKEATLAALAAALEYLATKKNDLI